MRITVEDKIKAFLMRIASDKQSMEQYINDWSESNE